MVRVRGIIGSLALVAAGALLGPAIYIAFADIGRHGWTGDTLLDTAQLVEIYDRHDNHSRVLSSTVDTTVQDCGYDDPPLFHGDSINPRVVLHGQRSTAWTPLTGYMDLWSWKFGEYVSLTQFERGRVLAAAFNPYAVRYLGDCIAETALSPVCESIVRSSLKTHHFEEAAFSPPEVDQTRENKTICAYLDGLRARAGKSLVPRK